MNAMKTRLSWSDFHKFEKQSMAQVNWYYRLNGPQNPILVSNQASAEVAEAQSTEISSFKYYFFHH